MVITYIQYIVILIIKHYLCVVFHCQKNTFNSNAILIIYGICKLRLLTANQVLKQTYK